MNFKKLKSQSGRSMVEMLGVLAIIGVLSVGGIAGYSLSMRRHRANQILDAAAKYAVIVYNQCQKKISDGLASDAPNCFKKESDVISFEDAGIGSFPAGLTGFSSTGFIIDAKTGVDVFWTILEFSDQKLCEAVGSITGTGCGSSGVVLQIKQN